VRAYRTSNTAMPGLDPGIQKATDARARGGTGLPGQVYARESGYPAMTREEATESLPAA